MKKRSGFTLIELLVVITIIGILSGMGIAQFRSSIEKAHLAKAQSAAAQFKRKVFAENVLFDTDLLAAWYTFDGDDFLVDRVNDASKNDNYVTHLNVPQSDDTGIGKGMSVELNNGMLFSPLPAGTFPLDKITMATWIQMRDLEAFSTYGMQIMGNTGLFVRSNGKIEFHINNGNNFVDSAEEVIKAGRWYFVVGSYDGESMRLWVDGELVGETPAVNNSSFDNGLLFLGTGNFRGKLDDTMLMTHGWNGEEFK